MADETTTTDAAGTKTGRKRVARKAVTTSGATVMDQVPVSDIVLDSDVQPREHISTGIISEYAEAMKAGAEFPAIIVFRDPETGQNIAADGWHRVMGARQAEKATILAEVRAGTKRDAVLYSVSANATHGLRRTDADKKRAVMRLLRDDEWSRWSANVIAEKVGVSQPFVSSLRKALDGDDAPSQVKTASGAVMDTTKIGRPRGSKTATTSTAPDQSNGHLTVVDRDGDAGGLLDQLEDDDGEAPSPVDPIATFAQDLGPVLLRFTDYDPDDVFARMSQDMLRDIAEKWDNIIEKIDGYSDALEKALEQPTTA